MENICSACGLERVAEEAVNHPQAGRAAFGPLWPEDRAVGGPWGAPCPNARLGHHDHCMEPETQRVRVEGQWALGICSSRLLVGCEGDGVVMTRPGLTQG